jgi:hypothetical protein
VKSSIQQYNETFEEPIPQWLFKPLADARKWDEAEVKLAQATKSGEPIKDWKAFADELLGPSGQAPKDR